MLDNTLLTHNNFTYHCYVYEQPYAFNTFKVIIRYDLNKTANEFVTEVRGIDGLKEMAESVIRDFSKHVAATMIGEGLIKALIGVGNKYE